MFYYFAKMCEQKSNAHIVMFIIAKISNFIKQVSPNANYLSLNMDIITRNMYFCGAILEAMN